MDFIHGINEVLGQGVIFISFRNRKRIYNLQLLEEEKREINIVALDSFIL